MRLAIGEGDVVCIDWDEQSMRIVEAGVSRGGLKIRSAVQVPVAAPEAARDPAELGAFIRRVMGEHRIRARRAVLAVPRQDSVLNLMTLPKGTQDELAAMIHIQIAKELPFAKDQTVIDFAVAPGSDAGNVEVWVAAVRNQIVDYYRQVIAAAGLRAERVGLRPYANLAAVGVFAEPQGRTLLVDIGPSMTEIDVVRNGQLAYSRAATVSVPVENGRAQVSGVLDALLVEVNRTIGAYRSTDPEAKIDRMVLSGSAEINASVVAAFQARFNVPVQVFTLPDALKWRGAPPATASFTAAVGLALGTTAEGLAGFNLLAPKEPEGERRERIRRVPYKAATIAALVALVLAGAYVPVYQRHRELNKLELALADRNKNKAARDELQKFDEVLLDWEKRSPNRVDQLKQLADVFPRTDKAYISKVDFKESGEITLDLMAADEFQANDLAARVNDLKLGTARVGIHADSNDEKYPIADHLIIQMKALSKTESAQHPATAPARSASAATAPAAPVHAAAASAPAEPGRPPRPREGRPGFGPGRPQRR